MFPENLIYALLLLKLLSVSFVSLLTFCKFLATLLEVST